MTPALHDLDLRGDGRVALITGGASGLGAGTARRFAEAGYRVALVDVDGVRGETTAGALRDSGAEVLFVAADVTDGAAVEAAFDAVAERWQRLDFVMNSAGVLGPQALLEEADGAAVCRLLDVNLKGTFFVLQQALRRLEAAGGGSVVTVASIAADANNAFFPGYSASKAGVIAMTRCAARHAGRANVRVNCLSPGSILDTRLSDPLFAGGAPDPGYRTRLAIGLMAQIPVGRAATPVDVADVALFLASPLARHVHGAVLTVDGGESLGVYQGGGDRKAGRTQWSAAPGAPPAADGAAADGETAS